VFVLLFLFIKESNSVDIWKAEKKYILRSVRRLQKVSLNTSYSVQKQENKIFLKKKHQNNQKNWQQTEWL